MCKNNFSLIWDKAIYFISKMPGGFVWTYVKYFLCYIISITIGYNSCSFILESFTTGFSICFALKSIKNPSFINVSYFIRDIHFIMFQLKTTEKPIDE